MGTAVRSKPLIGLIGFKQSGKSTAANHLVAKHGYYNELFASSLKNDLMHGLFGMNHAQVEGHLKEVVDEKYGMSPRQIMQLVATDWFRSQWPNFWVDKAWRSLEDKFGKVFNVPIVFSDVRFKNEEKLIRDKGGIIVRVVRLGQVSNDLHISEREQLEIKADHTIIAADGEVDIIQRDMDAIVEGGKL